MGGVDNEARQRQRIVSVHTCRILDEQAGGCRKNGRKGPPENHPVTNRRLWLASLAGVIGIPGGGLSVAKREGTKCRSRKRQ